jgi:hypothetical protein
MEMTKEINETSILFQVKKQGKPSTVCLLMAQPLAPELRNGMIPFKNHAEYVEISHNPTPYGMECNMI